MRILTFLMAFFVLTSFAQDPFSDTVKKLEHLKFLIKDRQIEKIIEFFNELSDEFNLDSKTLDWEVKNKNFN